MGFAAQDLEQVVGSLDAAVAGPPCLVPVEDLGMPCEGRVDGVAELGDQPGAVDVREPVQRLPGAASMSAQRASSRPRSQVRLRTGPAAQRCGDCVADVGGCVPVPQRPRPRTRSTRVAAALWLACPTIRSPSQWPVSLRFWTAAGRSLSGRRSPSGPACSARRLRGLRQRRRGRSFHVSAPSPQPLYAAR